MEESLSFEYSDFLTAEEERMKMEMQSVERLFKIHEY